MNRYRTHTCGELGKEDIGQHIHLSGWIDTIRDHGGIVFIDLRDHYGLTQVVINDSAMIKGLGRESVIMVSGLLRERSDETVNPKLQTGEIELFADELEVLSQAINQLPLDVTTAPMAREDVRLKYRFLDLRNPELHARIVTRSKIISFVRKKMEELGFLDIQTPILTLSLLEGARDYLVPSRKHKGMFYALPQAPQQFKQLLMVSGFDKYFQIAPCFRDEDARADRTPGEFYQLDFEMAFATQEDVLAVAETVMVDTFNAFTDKPVTQAPFPRIPYDEALLKYGSDHVDLRNPLIIEDLTDFFADVDFAAFKGSPVRGIVAPDSASKPRSFFDKMVEYATDIGMKGLGYITVGSDMELKGPIAKFLSDLKQADLIGRLNLKGGDSLFFISDVPGAVNALAGQIRSELGERLDLIDKDRFEFCYIVDYPMFERDEETGAIWFSHNPFSMPQGGMDALKNQDLLEVKAYQYDIVCNGVELSSGAVRNHRPDIMVEAFKIAGYDKSVLETKFPALYNAFHYGAPPHAGMAPGIDRIVRLITGQDNLREVIAFPMNGNAQDLLMGAPGEVSEQQLREVHIRIR